MSGREFLESAAPLGFFVNFKLPQPGAETVPGFTRSPLCGLKKIGQQMQNPPGLHSILN